MTKYLGEKMWQEFGHNTSAVRFGNILDSNGSVFQIWNKCVEENKPITLHTINGKPMKRFFITQHEAAKFIVEVYFNHTNNFIYFPSMPMIDMSIAALFFEKHKPMRVVDFTNTKENLIEKIYSDDEKKFVCEDNGVYAITNEICNSPAETKMLNYEETKAYLQINHVIT